MDPSNFTFILNLNSYYDINMAFFVSCPQGEKKKKHNSEF